jgi:hypothetical protein
VDFPRALPLAAFFEAFAGEAAGDEVRAAALEAELLAVGLDLDRLADRFEAEAAGEAVVEEFDVGVLEFDDAAAVDADEVVVGGFVDEVGVVGGLVVAEVDFAEEVGFDEQAEGAVDGGAGGVGVGFADAVEEFLGGEVFVLGEGGAGDALALGGSPQAFAADEFVQLLLNRFVHGVRMFGRVG